MSKLEIWRKQPEIVAQALREKKCLDCGCKISKNPSKVFCENYWRSYVPLAKAVEAQLV